jgi:uncharacterized membrane protein YfcA
MMEAFGYISALLIGLSLGLLGAGGSILTLPMMVYFFKVEPTQAVRYSMFVVGSTSMAATIPRLKKGEVLILQGSIFALISIIVVYLTRHFLLNLIPPILFLSEHLILNRETVNMVAFSVLMLCASKSLISSRKEENTIRASKPSELTIIAVAIMTGLLTGLLGAGGGFLIVPALMMFFHLDIKKAIATSLFIISLNTIAGFLCDYNQNATDWKLLVVTTLIALLGSLIGQQIAVRIPTSALKKSFGWFILTMAIIILAVEGFGLSIHKQ